MTWSCHEDELASKYNLELLARYIGEGWIDKIPDKKVDDRDGRTTGKHVCGHCGMRSDNPIFPMTCCRPRFEELGLLDTGSDQ